MELLKRAFINSIVQDLITLNGTEFEYFCLPIFEKLVGEVATHKGSNLYAKPISRTVDFSTDNFNIVGQCGTDEGYFDSFASDFDEILKLKIENTKPIKDINSALKNSSQCQEIYLFANQEAKAGRLDKVDKLIRHLALGRQVKVYDSEKIAEIVSDNVGDQRFVVNLLTYLPRASALYSAISKANELPVLPAEYISRQPEEDIIDLVQGSKTTALYGLSGIGKSKLALSVSHRLKNNFDSVVWIDASVAEAFDFGSVKVSGYDKNLNLAYICEKFSVLVILDNISGDAGELENKFKAFASEGSRLLITSIERVLDKSRSYQVSEMSDAESRELIKSLIDLNDSFVERIISQVGGHPLCLGLVCQIIKEEEFDPEEVEEFLGEIEQIPDEIVAGRSQTISDLVIGKYLEKFKTELSLIVLLNAEMVSNFVFNKLLGSKALRNLEKTALVVRSSPNYSTIHSIVLLSVKKTVANSQEVDKLTVKIGELLLEQNEFKNSGYYSFCVLHKQVLESLYHSPLNERHKKAILYAIVQVTDNLVHKGELVREIDSFDLSGNSLEDLLLLIESMELKLISIDRPTSPEDYHVEARRSIERLGSIEKSLQEGTPSMLLVRHHIAKLEYWDGNAERAKLLFENLLKDYPGSEQCILQLARIADNSKNLAEVERYVSMVLDSSASEASYSIILSFYDLMANSKYKNLRAKYIEARLEKFLSDISINLRSSFDHPYRILSRLSSYLGFELPDAFKELSEALPPPDNIDTNQKLMMAYADIQAALYRLFKYKKFEGREAKLDYASGLAKHYYSHALRDGNDYTRVKVAKFYIEIGDFDEAGRLLDEVENCDAFFHQARAKQLRGQKNFTLAINQIDLAIDKLGTEKNLEHFLTSFLNDKAEIFLDCNIDEAIKILELAISKQSNFKTKAAWERKLGFWRQRRPQE